MIWARPSTAEGKVPEARTAMQNALQTGTAFAQTNEARRFLSMTALADVPAQALAAQPQVEAILKSAPDNVPALMVKAAIAEQKPDLAAAAQTYEGVLKHYPDFAPAQKRLAILYAKDPKNDAKAYPLAVKARDAFPSRPGSRPDSGHHRLSPGGLLARRDFVAGKRPPKNQRRGADVLPGHGPIPPQAQRGKQNRPPTGIGLEFVRRAGRRSQTGPGGIKMNRI